MSEEVVELGVETCAECNKVFDLQDVIQALEFFFGHDCEPAK
jgi:hypothetical protein